MELYSVYTFLSLFNSALCLRFIIRNVVVCKNRCFLFIAGFEPTAQVYPNLSSSPLLIDTGLVTVLTLRNEAPMHISVQAFKGPVFLSRVNMPDLFYFSESKFLLLFGKYLVSFTYLSIQK